MPPSFSSITTLSTRSWTLKSTRLSKSCPYGGTPSTRFSVNTKCNGEQQQHQQQQHTPQQPSSSSHEGPPKTAAQPASPRFSHFKELWRGLNRPAKIVIIAFLAIDVTAETIFWTKTLWKYFSRKPEAMAGDESGQGQGQEEPREGLVAFCIRELKEFWGFR